MSVALDTLRFTQRLEQVGVSREQAMAHAELACDMIVADVAAKDDLAPLKRDIDGSLRELELRTQSSLGRSSRPPWQSLPRCRNFSDIRT